jgi:hypothetical protein
MIGIIGIIGLVIFAFGAWLISFTSDPLGYSPPFAYWPILIGGLLIAGAILAKVLI